MYTFSLMQLAWSFLFFAVIQLLCHIYSWLLAWGFPPPPYNLLSRTAVERKRVRSYLRVLTAPTNISPSWIWFLRPLLSKIEDLVSIFSTPFYYLLYMSCIIFVLSLGAGFLPLHGLLELPPSFLGLGWSEQILVTLLAAPLRSGAWIVRAFLWFLPVIEIFWLLYPSQTRAALMKANYHHDPIFKTLLDRNHGWFRPLFLATLLKLLASLFLLAFVHANTRILWSALFFESSASRFFSYSDLLAKLSVALSHRGLVMTIVTYLTLVLFFAIYCFSVLLFYRVLIFLFYEFTNKDLICSIVSLDLLRQTRTDECLVFFEERLLLIYRLDYLAKMTLQLSDKSYIYSKFARSWVPSHFMALYAYVIERKRWAISPRTNTFDYLRDDIKLLADIFVSRRFGEFNDYSCFNMWKVDPKVVLRSKKSWLLKSLPHVQRFIGIILPLIVMGVLILQNDDTQFLPSFISVDDDVRDIITYVFFAWLLIGIDVYCNIGVVDSIIQAAKGLKDLD